MYNTESIAATKSFREKRVVRNRNVQSNKSVGYEMTAQLLPFKSTMKRQLKRRGYNVDFMPFNLIVPLYYNELISNKNNSNSNFVPINCFEYAENPAFKIKLNDEVNGDLLTHRNVQYFNHVASITDEIINAFRIAKLKKEALGLGNFETSAAMTKDEQIQANTAIKVEKDLESKLIGERPFTIKNIKTLLIIVAVFYLLWYMS
jgi:hypothetical protein